MTKRMCGMALAAAAVPVAVQLKARADISGFGDGSTWTVNSGGIFTPTFNSPSDLTITDSQNGEVNSVFFNDVQRDNNFTASFHYNFLNGSANPADGVVFVLQNSASGANALGGGGGNLGYGGINNSAGFEINIYAPNTRGTAYHEQGATGGYLPAGTIDWSSTSGVDITLQYNGTFLSETISQGANTFTNRIAADIVSAVGGATNALVGFTGATGGENAEQHISNFSFVTGTNTAGPGIGTDYHWTAADGNWTNSVNWVPPTGFPGSSAAVLDNAFVDNPAGLVTGATARVTSVLANPVNNIAVSNNNTLSFEGVGAITGAGSNGIQIGADGTDGKLTMRDTSSLSVQSGSVIGGNGGNATVTLAGSANLSMQGGNFGSNGGNATINVSGNAVMSSVGNLTLGNGGNAALTINSGSVNTTAMLIVGSGGGGGAGTVNLGGSGVITSGNSPSIGAAGGVGVLNLSGGTLNAGFDTLDGPNTGTVGAINQTGGVYNQTGGHWMFIGLRGGTGSYNMSGGTINASSRFYVGIDGGSTGSMTMTAGTIIGGAEFDVGVGGATGEFDQRGGTITLNHNGANAWVIIGQNGGNGTYNLSGGSMTLADRFYVGTDPNSQGLMNMTGGTVVTGAEFDIGVNHAVGVLNQSAGSITVNHNGANAWNIVGQTGGNGTYNMTGGTATFADRAVIGTDAPGGVSSQGLLIVTNTAQYTTGDLLLIGSNDAQGTVNLGGSASLTAVGDTRIGDGGTGASSGLLDQTGGTFTQGDGTTNHATWTYVGAGNLSTGTYNLSGTAVYNNPLGSMLVGSGSGSTASVNVSGSARLNFGGGTNQTITIGRPDGAANAVFNMGGGTINAPGVGVIVNPGGAFLHTGGSATVGQFSQLAGGTAIIGGGATLATLNASGLTADTFTVTNQGRVTLTPLATPHAATNTVTTLAVGGNGVLDLGNQDLLLDNTATPEAKVHQYLHNGYNAGPDGIGNWLGTGGITSSDAIKSHNGTSPDFRVSVGYINGAYASDPLVGPIPGHETLPATQILVRPALYGDLNLDGKVDDTDLQIFSGLGQYNKPTDKYGWFGGDLNHDGKVDDTDLQIFSGAGNYNGPTYGAAAAGAAHASATAAAPSLTGHAEANGDIVLSASTSQGAAGDGVLDFVYDPSSGHLTLSYDGDPRVTAAQPFQVVRFKSAGSHFIPANFNQTDFGAGVTATTAALNGTASGSNSVPDGYDMGAVLPTGLTVSDLTSDLTLQWNVFGGGLTLKNGDVVVPEPATLSLIGLGAVGLLARRRKQRS